MATFACLADGWCGAFATSSSLYQSTTIDSSVAHTDGVCESITRSGLHLYNRETVWSRAPITSCPFHCVGNDTISTCGYLRLGRRLQQRLLFYTKHPAAVLSHPCWETLAGLMRAFASLAAKPKAALGFLSR